MKCAERNAKGGPCGMKSAKMRDDGVVRCHVHQRQFLETGKVEAPAREPERSNAAGLRLDLESEATVMSSYKSLAEEVARGKLTGAAANAIRAVLRDAMAHHDKVRDRGGGRSGRRVIFGIVGPVPEGEEPDAPRWETQKHGNTTVVKHGIPDPPVDS